MLKVNLNGTILDNDECDIMRWWGWLDVVCPLDVEKILKTDPLDEVTVYINSPGGSMLAGSQIRSMLKEHIGHTKAAIQSHAASAATIAMSGCDKVVSEPAALICVHNPSMREDGTAEAHIRVASELETVKESVMNAYMTRCKLSREELSALMNEDKWLCPQDALEYGIIDAISEGETLEGPQVITNVCGATTIHPSAQMRDEYQKHIKNTQEARRTKAIFEVLAK